jgi:hypothetical protein
MAEFGCNAAAAAKLRRNNLTVARIAWLFVKRPLVGLTM